MANVVRIDKKLTPIGDEKYQVFTGTVDAVFDDGMVLTGPLLDAPHNLEDAKRLYEDRAGWKPVLTGYYAYVITYDYRRSPDEVGSKAEFDVGGAEAFVDSVPGCLRRDILKAVRARPDGNEEILCAMDLAVLPEDPGDEEFVEFVKAVGSEKLVEAVERSKDAVVFGEDSLRYIRLWAMERDNDPDIDLDDLFA